MNDDAELAEVFRAESAELVERLGDALLGLEAEGPEGPARAEAFRIFHTLKGMANMAGMPEVARVCHAAESTLAAGGDPDPDDLLHRLDDVARLLRGEAPHDEDAPAADARPTRAFVPVDVRRLDALVNLAGELAVAEARLRHEARAQDGRPGEDSMARLSHLVRALQEETMRARLTPIRSLFAPVPRLARDAAHVERKAVRVEVDDGRLEIDRGMVDRMTGVLAHLVQNAVVHGIERPEERMRAGKPAEGLVAVRARREHETTVLELEDDGRGIDLERVREEAVERGLLAPEATRALAREEIVDVLATAGFTTASSAGAHAGRGVGLTAVREAVRGMGGSLAIGPREGGGTRVTVRLPPSVAVLDTLLARAAGSTVALPLRQVRRVVPYATLRVAGAGASVVHEDRLVPVLHVTGEAATEADGYVVVARGARGTFGLAVDRVLGMQSSILKPLDHASTARALGATVLADGRPAVVLDLDSFTGV